MASGEQQHQEALVAGESPDRSERERSSGETTESGGVVARPEETAENERLSGAGASVPAPASPVGDETDGDTNTPETPGDDTTSEVTEAPEAPGDDAVSGVSEVSEVSGVTGAPEISESTEAGKGDANGSKGRKGPKAPEGDRADRTDRTDRDAKADKADKDGKDGKDEGDARLKSAVAAWVAAEEPPEAPEGAADEADPRSDSEAPESAEGDATRTGSGQADESAAVSDLPVRPKQAAQSKQSKQSKQAKQAKEKRAKQADKTDGASTSKPADSAPEGDAPTAMFGILRPDQLAAAKDSDEAAAERAERLTSAFFGSSKGEKKDDEKSGSDSDSGSGSGSGEGGDTGAGASAGPGAKAAPKSGSKPGSKAASEPTSKSGVKADPEPGSGSASKSGAKGDRPVDQPTATFRTKGAKDSKASTAAEKTETEGAKGAQEAKKTGDSAPKPAVDQPTAVFRAPTVREGNTKSDTKDPRAEKTGTGETEETAGKGGKSAPSRSPGGKGSAAAAAGTAASKGDSKDAKDTQDAKASGAEAKAAPKADPRKRDGESEAERTSQFVPLKSADAPRTPAKSLPPQAPTGPPGPPAPPRPPGAPRSADGAGAASTAGPGAQGHAAPEMTRQQPMPEPPPLDLLAQLTNTPPPAETALRTLTRRVKIWTPLVLLLVVVFVVVQAVRPLPGPELSMTASSTYAFEGAKPSVPWPSEGQAKLEVDGLGSLGSYGKQKPVPIASVAKVMTAYVILRDHPVKKGSKGALIPVDQKAEDEAGLSAQNESTVEVQAGEKITQREAMDAIMIASANNVARLLARWDAGSEKAFVKKMNDAAKDLGMTNSKYTDPSGLRAETVSTATDQVKLGRKVMEKPLFREVVRQPQYQDGQGKTQGNWNKLVPVDGVVGIKTGTTTKAGGNLLFAAEKEIGGTKQLIVGAVLGQYKPSILDTVLAESKKLIDTAQDSMETRKVVKKGDVVGYVDDQLGGKTPVVATKDVTAVGWAGLKVKLGLDKGGSIPHEAKPGTKVGTLTVGDGPGQVKVPVALQESMGEPGFGSKLTRVG